MKNLASLYFYPTTKEVETAMAIFESQLARHRECNSNYCAIKCALADVWAAARFYEHEKESAVMLPFCTEST